MDSVYQDTNVVAEHFTVKEVSADKAYLSHKNLQAVSSIGGTAFVPFKSNTQPPAENGSAWSQMYHYFMQNRESFLEHYHKRSNAETVFSQIKGKFGDSLRSKSDVGQVNEAICRAIVHCITLASNDECRMK